jgi:hypothetical protein
MFRDRVNKDSVGDYLNPVLNDRDKLIRKGIKPKNHQFENFQKLKEQNNALRNKKVQV